MEASRLLEVLEDIEAETDGGLTRHLSTLLQQYTSARDSPTVDNTPTIQSSFATLVNYIDQGKFSQYPPSKKKVLDAIGGDNRLGHGLQERLTGLLSIQGQTTAGIVTALTTLQSDIATFKKSCAQTRTGLKALGITPHIIPTGEFEVGVLIPETLVDRKLSSVLKELGTWNSIVRGFQEVADEEEREVTVSGLSSGSYETYIPLGMAAATYLSLTINKVLEWYLKILEIRMKRQEFRDLGAPVDEVTAIQKHEKEFIEKNIKELAKEIVKSAQPKTDAPRRHELETHISISIKQITRVVDRGGTVEVTSTPPEVIAEPEPLPEEATAEEEGKHKELLQEYKKLSSQFQRVTEIMQSGGALRRLPDRPEPILQIESEVEQENVPGEKPAKKKS